MRVPNQRRWKEEDPEPRPGLIPGSIPDTGGRLGQNKIFLLVEEPGLLKGRLNILSPLQDPG